MTKAVGWSNWLCPPATKYHTDRNNIVTVAGMTGTSRNGNHPVTLEGTLASDLYISNPNNIADMHIAMINRFFTKQMKLTRLPLLHLGTVFLTLNTNIVVQIISSTENAISVGA
ncbi:hypothetical protein MNBD_GAMMA09-3724 [hydrothermal vent metagenome]|uniref:Uncharacterized protein n=1 Tax=hydrothermal vent metagenome TaxID=652676 RepID=A0A3B0Y1H4_9ZZZZ